MIPIPEIHEEIIERAVTLAKLAAMNSEMSPLTEVEETLIRCGALNALTVLTEMSCDETSA